MRGSNRAPNDILDARTLPEIALPSPEAPLARQGGLMPPAQELSLQGTVVAVAADRGHHFSKAPQDRIMLVEGHGVEGDARAFVRHRYLARRQPHLPNRRQVYLMPSELFTSLLEAGFKVAAGALAVAQQAELTRQSGLALPLNCSRLRANRRRTYKNEKAATEKSRTSSLRARTGSRPTLQSCDREIGEAWKICTPQLRGL